MLLKELFAQNEAKKLKEGKRESKLLDAFAKEYGDLDEDDREVWAALKKFLEKNGKGDMFDAVQAQLYKEWEEASDDN